MRAYRDHIFGTEVSLAGLAAPAEEFGWLRTVESTLSRFDPGSELSRLNQARTARVSPLLLDVLLAACRWMACTDGLVSPFLGAELRRLGYDRSYELLGGHDAPTPAPAARGGEVRIDPDDRTVELPPGVELDLGGFAKGWAAARVRARQRTVRGLVNIGGDLVCWSSEQAWTIGIGDGPLRVHVHDTAAATSSTMRRTWNAGGVARHHLIDPRTAMSTDTDCVQATVLAQDPIACEVAAKCCVLLGIEQAGRFVADLVPGAEWALLDRSGRWHRSDNLPSTDS
ncbi:FAD:protein FMN transferase [Saccharomonospora sp. NPDC046836]|uniref:FAD:protein FMN transferase n=1 Tax=Saccharomonospora sp. NPDC046836 TaxID=3156921 RepID=UPI0033E28F4F